MPIISRTSIENIRHKVNIVEVVSPVVRLRKSGLNFRGLSPFTNEKTPSFYVLPEKNIFKCFSSGEAGDVFKFVQLTERLNFQEAVEALAARYNIPVEYEKGTAPKGFKPSIRKEILDIHDFATVHYHNNFLADTPEGKKIRNYWRRERKFSLEVARQNKIGLALPDESSLYQKLQGRNFSREALEKCGLFFSPRQAGAKSALFPRFRGRLMIPIREHANQRVIAFTARQLDLTPRDDPSREAKYINSPETPLFNKSRTLFGLHHCKKDVSPANPFILVEGQLDAIRCWTIGLPAVAPQGTSITENQLLLLKRFNEEVVFLFDGDEAGEKAALRALPMAWNVGLDIRFYTLKEGEDPDDVILKSGNAFASQVKEGAISALQFAIDVLLPHPAQATPQEKDRAAKATFALLSNLGSELMRIEYLAQLSRLLRIEEAALSTDFKNYLSAKEFRSNAPWRVDAPAKNQPKDKKNSKLTNAEEDLILALFENPDLGESLSQVIDNEWIDDSQASGRILKRILVEVDHGSWRGVNGMDELLETDKERNYFFEIWSKERLGENLVRGIEEAVILLYKRYVRLQIKSLDTQIQIDSAHLKNSKKITAIMKQRRDLKLSINNPPNLLQSIDL